MLSRTAYGGEIAEAAAEHGLDPKLVEAMVIVESGGKTSAFRYEPGVWAWLQKNPKYAKQNPLRAASSYGLMQILACTAHDMGFPMSDPPEKLFIPQVGLTFACKYFASLLKKFPGDRDRAIAAYNIGPGKSARQADGAFINQAYVAKVLKHFTT